MIEEEAAILEFMLTAKQILSEDEFKLIEDVYSLGDGSIRPIDLFIEESRIKLIPLVCSLSKDNKESALFFRALSIQLKVCAVQLEK